MSGRAPQAGVWPGQGGVDRMKLLTCPDRMRTGRSGPQERTSGLPTARGRLATHRNPDNRHAPRKMPRRATTDRRSRPCIPSI
ncbi:hypothetical protein L533_2494 [Bordetella bronchiseptica OSU553]|nr:hypothetical protein L533_2494 [Bordetella bronchiseptica OSU553]